MQAREADPIAFATSCEGHPAFHHAEKTKDIHSFQLSCSRGNRTRYFLKVQDGCNYFCTYCTIPYARGFSRNPSIATLVEQVKQAAAEGGKEVVITGVNIGDFGRTTRRAIHRPGESARRDRGHPPLSHLVARARPLQRRTDRLLRPQPCLYAPFPHSPAEWVGHGVAPHAPSLRRGPLRPQGGADQGEDAPRFHRCGRDGGLQG